MNTMIFLIGLTVKIWFIPSLLMSLFWGIRSWKLYGGKSYWWKFYQFIFNFVGSFAGWVCLFILLIRFRSYFPELQGFNAGDIVLFFIAFLGLTGHLPQVMAGIITALGKLIVNLVSKIDR